MLAEAMQVLASAGGTALVGAMATDAWQTARRRVASLFRHAGEQRRQAIEAQLDGNVVLVEHAPDPDQARQGLLPLWQMELARLLEEHPEAELELRELIADVHDKLPTGQKLWVQNITASAPNAKAMGAMFGNVIYHESSATKPGLPEPPQSGGSNDGAGGPP
jgi:hypothetical protein